MFSGDNGGSSKPQVKNLSLLLGIYFLLLCILWFHHWWSWPFCLIMWLSLSLDVIHLCNLRWMFHYSLCHLLCFENHMSIVCISWNWVDASCATLYLLFCTCRFALLWSSLSPFFHLWICPRRLIGWPQRSFHLLQPIP
jgi:hypothetical protein